MRRELLAGLTTFMTMAYVVVVNPQILAEGGMPVDGVLFATCVSAAIATVIMGLWANYPIALAPGMSLNAYFTYSIVLGRGVPWQTALGVVFLSGLLFLILTLSKNARASRQRDSGLPQAWDRGGHRGCSSRSPDYVTRKSLWPIPLLSWGSANLPTHRVLLAAAGLTAIRIS